MAEYVNINTGTINKNVPTKETFDAARPRLVRATLPANAWVNNTQTITVEGILADGEQQIIIPVPKLDSTTAYMNTGVYCSSQANDSLTFIANITPSVDLNLDITIQALIVPPAPPAPPPAPIYGVQWANMATNPTGVRTDDAVGFADPSPAVAGGTGSSPFDSIMPWAGMVRSTDPNVGEVVSIPKFYYKWETDGTKMTGLKISMEKKEGFNTSPAHMNRGDGKGERDVVYVGRYHSCSTNKSTTGQMPKANITRSNARTAVHSLGANVWQFDFATRVTIWMLYLVEFADWNSQAKIGYGCGNNSSVKNVGASDNMQYHTGTMQADRTTSGVGVQYRYIEGLWDNVYDWMDGCYYSANGMSVILNPNNFSDTENGTVIGTPSSGYPSAFAVSDWAIYPNSTTGGSSTTGSCDSWNYYSSNPCLYCGGSYSRSEYYGLFCVNCNGVSDAFSYVGFRALILP